jgi:transcription initiation factor TFIIIB Brf1 subunit/transcription initiation factor TFIIB
MDFKKSLLFPFAGIIVEAVEEYVFDDTPSVEEDEPADVCPGCECYSMIVQEKDEMICKRCNEHISYVIDSGAEYRYFGPEGGSPDPTRVGGPKDPLLPESSTATRMMIRPGDSPSMRRLRQIHMYSMPSRERTRWNTFGEIDIRATNGGISSAITEETKHMFSHISPYKVFRKVRKDSIIAACIFESIKAHGSAQPLKEIAKKFSVNTSSIIKGLKTVSELMEKYNHEHTVEKDMPMTTSTTFRDYIEAALVRLSIPRTMLTSMQSTAIEIGLKVDELAICPEATPPSLAATAIALACEAMEYSKPNNAIAAALNISIATLSKCLKRCMNKEIKTILFSKDR